MHEQRRIRAESPLLHEKRTSKSHYEKLLFLTKTSLLYLESRMLNVNNQNHNKNNQKTFSSENQIHMLYREN